MSPDMSVVGAETFGQRIKRIRQHKGIRQIDLAATAGISWRHLIRIEQDKGGVTKPATIGRLADALGVHPTELTGDEDEESDLVMDLDSLLRVRIRQIIREEAQL